MTLVIDARQADFLQLVSGHTMIPMIQHVEVLLVLGILHIHLWYLLGSAVIARVTKHHQ